MKTNMQYLKTAGFLVMLCMFSQVMMSQTDNSKKPTPVKTYRNQIGVRIGHTSGVTYKYFIDRSRAFDYMIGVRPGGFNLTGLYVFHEPINENKEFTIYYGFGAHITNEKGTSIYHIPYEDQTYTYLYRTSGIGAGTDITFGVEYTIPTVPIALSINLKPFIEFSTTTRSIYTALDPGVSIKFLFK